MLVIVPAASARVATVTVAEASSASVPSRQTAVAWQVPLRRYPTRGTGGHAVLNLIRRWDELLGRDGGGCREQLGDTPGVSGELPFELADPGVLLGEAGPKFADELLGLVDPCLLRLGQGPLEHPHPQVGKVVVSSARGARRRSSRRPGPPTASSAQRYRPSPTFNPQGEQDDSPAHIPGTPRGRKRLLQVYLPAGARHLLGSAHDGHGGLGAAAMAALRASYEHIVAHHIPEPVEPVGPFPAPRTVRRREHVDDARMKPIYVDPAEAAAIEALADRCELSISELVTVAIDWWYGEDRPSPHPTKTEGFCGVPVPYSPPGHTLMGNRPARPG